MKLHGMAWVMGGLAAVGLGMGVEACSSNSSGGLGGDGGIPPVSSSSSSTATAPADSCALLAACCDSSPTVGSQCTSTGVLGSANAASCASFLAMVMKDGFCTGVQSSAGNSSPVQTSGATTSTPTGGTSTTQTTSTGVTTGGNSSGQTTTSGGSGSGSGSCTDVPKLYPETTAGVYCPYSGVDGGPAKTCTGGQQCCEYYENDAGVAPPSICTTASCGTNAVTWVCLEAPDCASNSHGKVCCATGTLEPVVGCGYDRLSGFKGTSCESSCATGTTQVCEQDSDCSGGATCVPAKAEGNDFGVCVASGS